eukprot:TRINITY_DN11025_c0_g4_i1.p1 TRINITY_DN11025_c0_g4~~TRINITY_DN11025_c0_g4_i1.p1  ORF type:complete len:253 (+),score=51.85 TRINITY_DN11025_c0_g4_i1:93-851(+)
MAEQRRDHKRDEANTIKITDALIRAKSGEYDLLCVGRLILTNLGIRKMEGLDGLKNLVELNLTKNSIESIQGIANLKNLRKLVLISNRISKLENMDNMTSLEHLHLQDNAIQEVEEVTHLNTLPRLHSLYLQNTGGDLANPVCSRKGYRGFVLQYLPSLIVLDGERISSAEALNASLMTNSLMGVDNSGPLQIPEYKSWALALRWEDAFIPKEKVERSINTELFKSKPKSTFPLRNIMDVVNTPLVSFFSNI